MPAPFVERELSRAALRRGNVIAATRYAAKLPAGVTRDALFAAIARLRGEHDLAVEYELAGLDLPRIRDEINTLAVRDPRAAYALAVRLHARLLAAPSHPDALADSSWRIGVLASTIATHGNPRSRSRWSKRALAALLNAAAIAPYNNTYQLALGAYYFNQKQFGQAQFWYARTIAGNPTSADAWAGLGRVALQRGSRATARADLAQAMRYGATSRAVLRLSAMLRRPPTR